VEVGPIIAQAAARRSGQAVGLPALAALLLASFSIAFSVALSTAVAALAPGLPDGPVLHAAPPEPGATASRADIRLLPLRTGGGSADLDVLSGYLQATPAAESLGVTAVTGAVTDPYAPGAERHHRGRAPPHAR
jgi:hypothetical protein